MKGLHDDGAAESRGKGGQSGGGTGHWKGKMAGKHASVPQGAKNKGPGCNGGRK